MKTKSITVLFYCFLIFIHAYSIEANENQSHSNNYLSGIEKLREFKPENIYYIKFHDNRSQIKVTGRDLNWSRNYLLINYGGMQNRVPANQIYSISWVDQSRKQTGKILGAAIGGVTGIGTGLLLWSSFDCTNSAGERDCATSIDFLSFLAGSVATAILMPVGAHVGEKIGGRQFRVEPILTPKENSLRVGLTTQLRF